MRPGSMRKKKSAGTFVPADAHAEGLLLETRDAGLRDHVVLRTGTAAHADRADDLAVDHQRVAAARGHDVIERRQIIEERPLADQPFEHHGRPPIAGSGARLVLRNRDRGVLTPVVALEIDKLAMRIDDHYAHALPVALVELGDRGGRDLLGGLVVDRLAIGRWRHRLRHVLIRVVRIGRNLGESHGAGQQHDAQSSHTPTQTTHLFLPLHVFQPALLAWLRRHGYRTAGAYPIDLRPPTAETEDRGWRALKCRGAARSVGSAGVAD